jgi:hypothetical protein
MIVATFRVDGNRGYSRHQEPAIMVGEPDATMKLTPQAHQLMSKQRVLSLKPQLRLEWQSQNDQYETE